MMVKRSRRTVLLITFLGALIPFSLEAQGWEAVSTGVTNDLNDLFFSDSDLGYVVGGASANGGSGIILKTSDGGESWASQTIPDLADVPAGEPFLNGIDCADALSCFAVGSSGAVLRTTDGGTTWSGQVLEDSSVAGGIQRTLTDVAVVNASGPIVVAVGEQSVIFRTTNGTDWSQISAPSGVESNLQDVFFVDSTTGWIGALESVVLNSTDGGASWTLQNPGDDVGVFDLFALDTLNVWLAGDIDSSGAAMRKTSDGGATWVAQGVVSPTVTFRGIHMIDSLVGFAVGNSGIIRKTTDGGTTWAEADEETDSGTSAILRGIQCLNSELCLVVGDDGTVLSLTLASGSDGDGDGDDDGDGNGASDGAAGGCSLHPLSTR